MFDYTFHKHNAAEINSETLAMKSRLLEEGVNKDRDNKCLKVNYIIDQWRQGNIMDNKFCEMVQDTQWQILFSKATGYPVAKVGFEYKEKADNLMMNQVELALQSI